MVKTVDTSPFWSSLVSNIIVVGLLSLFLPWYIAYTKRPKKLEFFFRNSGSDSVYLKKIESDEIKYELDLAIRHPSGHSFINGVYWHLYFPKNLNPITTPLELNTLPRQQEEKGISENWVHFSGKIANPIFTGTTQAFLYKFSGALASNNEQGSGNDKVTIHYYFSTEYGNYPRTVKFPNSASGAIDIATTGELYIEIIK